MGHHVMDLAAGMVTSEPRGSTQGGNLVGGHAEGVEGEVSESGRVGMLIRSSMGDRMQGWGACGPMMGSREDSLCFLTQEGLRGETEAVQRGHCWKNIPEQAGGRK